MPVNFPPEYKKAKEKYENARNLQEKIKYTQEMISKCPKHKGAENVLKNLRKRSKRLREKKEKRKEVAKGGHSLGVEKQGYQVCIAGYPNTGKSTLLKKLTNAEPEIAKYSYTTQEPEVGMLNHKGAKIQLVDLPPITENAVEKQGEVMSIIKNTDGLIIKLGEKPKKEERTIKKELEKIDAHNKPIMKLKKHEIPEKRKVFNQFNLIKIYTKKPGEEPDKENPLVLKKGSTVQEAGEEIHRDFSEKLEYVKVWGSSTDKYNGQRVKKDHVLEDEDTIEIHIK